MQILLSRRESFGDPSVLEGFPCTLGHDMFTLDLDDYFQHARKKPTYPIRYFGDFGDH